MRKTELRAHMKDAMKRFFPWSNRRYEYEDDDDFQYFAMMLIILHVGKRKIGSQLQDCSTPLRYTILENVFFHFVRSHIE